MEDKETDKIIGGWSANLKDFEELQFPANCLTITRFEGSQIFQDSEFNSSQIICRMIRCDDLGTKGNTYISYYRILLPIL